MSLASVPRIAIVGAGPAGISAAYHLREHARLTIFDREDHPGGHANTVEVEENGQILGCDTAFIVYNRPSYKVMSKVFDELGVAEKEHLGGFYFFDLEAGIEYGTEDLDLSEEEVAARYSPEFVSVWKEIGRFHAESRRDFFRKRTDMPLGEYLDRGGYSEAFRHSYLMLLCSAVWSVPPELIWEMPAATVIAFYMGHDEGGLGGRRVDWRTVSGGSISYVRKAMAAIAPELRTSELVTGIRQEPDGVTVTTGTGSERFDYAVLATHADEGLAILANPTPHQRDVLATVRYNGLRVVLHTDASVMSANKDRWKSWNYGKVNVNGKSGAYVAYYLNHLHGFTAEKDYFVTLDYPGDIDPDCVIAEFDYNHPILDINVRNMQNDIYQVNEATRVKLCGSYFHSKDMGVDLIGSHEAAFASGKEAAEQLLREMRSLQPATQH
jgi:uncharacterized protein